MAAPRWKDMLIDQGTGAMSSSKLWSHVSKLVATWIVIHVTLTSGTIDEMLFLIYIVAVGTETLLSKLISFRLGGGNNTVDPLEPISNADNKGNKNND